MGWGYQRRPREESDALKAAAVASQRDAARQKEVQTMAETMAEWLAKQGEKKGRKDERLRTLRETLRILLEERFQSLPEALQQRIEATTDPKKLQSCIRQVLHIKSLEDLHW